MTDTFYNIPEFDPWYDGNLSLAKNIVKIFRNSDNFRLTDYEGQIDFYEEYLSKYEGFVSTFHGLANEKNINPEAYLQVLDKIRTALNILAENKILNYGHLLGAYIQVFLYNDMIKNIQKVQNSLRAIGREDITENSSVDDIINVLNNFYLKDPYVVPFTSRTGAFGLNTFLYLYFNGIYPVAASIDPYPVHNGLFPGSLATMFHDYPHLYDLKVLSGADTTNTISSFKIPDSLNLEAYYASLKNIYRSIFENKYDLGSDVVKILVLFIFYFLHENFKIITCPTMDVTNASLDEIPVMMRNKTFSPERYGLSTVNIFNMINDEDPEYIGAVDAFKYKQSFLEEASKILCDNFGYLLPKSGR